MNKIPAHICATVTVLLAFVSGFVHGQVTNNRIENRIPLELDDEAFSSFTTNSDVQWDCINKALTNKCLVYHNDQWFTITPTTTGPFFINIHNQSCKKLYGVQLVILEGDPCKTDSYQLKRCVPFSDQSDFYVRLDSLKPNEEYLINVDGFLGDLCGFKIEFSSSLRGVPVNAINTKLLTPSMTLKDSIVSLGWSVNDSLAFTVKDFQVYRKKDKEKSIMRAAMPIVHNAYGSMQKDYVTNDTLWDKGAYTYFIYGSTADDKLLLSQQSFIYPPEKPSETSKRIRLMRREIVYHTKSRGMVTVNVFDDFTDRKLLTTNRTADKGKNVLLLDFSDMVEEGIYFYKIVITGKEYTETFKVRVDPPHK
jgi:hypothetical protein